MSSHVRRSPGAGEILSQAIDRATMI